MSSVCEVRKVIQTIYEPFRNWSEESGIKEENSDFIEKYIPSVEVKKAIREANHVFSDREKASIVWNSEETILVKHHDILSLAESTDDVLLKEQIEERIAYDEKAIELFCNNRDGFVYAVNSFEYEGEDYVIGYFGTIDLAWDAGVRKGFGFDINKYQIIKADTDIIKPRSISSPIIEPDVAKQVTEEDFEGCPVSRLTFDAGGRLMMFYSHEVSIEEQTKVGSLGNHRFENTFVVFPNPFMEDEYVHVIGEPEGCKSEGWICTSKRLWDRLVEKATSPGAIEDWSDANLVIRYWDDQNRYWDHRHVNPIYLERMES